MDASMQKKIDVVISSAANKCQSCDEILEIFLDDTDDEDSRTMLQDGIEELKGWVSKTELFLKKAQDGGDTERAQKLTESKSTLEAKISDLEAQIKKTEQ